MADTHGESGAASNSKACIHLIVQTEESLKELPLGQLFDDTLTVPYNNLDISNDGQDGSRGIGCGEVRKKLVRQEHLSTVICWIRLQWLCG